jgi:O-antigen/teichoic acid export membrane protein
LQESSDRYRLISFAAWQSGSFAVSGALRLVAVGVVGRALQPQTFGALQYATSLYYSFYALSEFGLVALGTRLVAQSPERATIHARVIGRARFVMATAAFVLLAGLSGWIAGPDRTFLILYGLGLFVQAAMLDWALRGLGRVNAVASVEMLRSLGYLFAVLALVRGPEHAVRVIVLQLGSVAASALVLRLMLGARRAAAQGHALDEPLASVIRAAAPIAAGDIVASVYGQCDLVALRWLGSAGDVGFYAPGMRMIQPLVQLISVALLGWLPVLTSAFGRSRDAFAALMADLEEALAWALVPATAAGWLLAPRLLQAFFGASYAPGQGSFQVLVAALGVLAWRAPLSVAFIATGREWAYLKVILGATVLKLAAAAALVPRLGPVGAAAAALVGDVGFAIASLLSVQTVAARILVRAVAGPAAATLLATAGFWGVEPAGRGLAWVVAAILYTAVAATLFGPLQALRRFWLPTPQPDGEPVGGKPPTDA